MFINYYLANKNYFFNRVIHLYEPGGIYLYESGGIYLYEAGINIISGLFSDEFNVAYYGGVSSRE